MAVAVKTFRIMVGGPGDTTEHRRIVQDAIHAWNNTHYRGSGIWLVPVDWEIDALPNAGHRTQTVINEEVAAGAVGLIVIFNERLGTATGDYPSGSVEEIELFKAQGLTIVLYFSEQDVSRSKLQDPQVLALEGYKKSIRDTSFYVGYLDLEAFKTKVTHHVALIGERLRERYQGNDGAGVDRAPFAESTQIATRKAASAWTLASRLPESRRLDAARSAVMEWAESMGKISAEHDFSAFPAFEVAIADCRLEATELAPFDAGPEDIDAFWKIGDQWIQRIRALAAASANPSEMGSIALPPRLWSGFAHTACLRLGRLGKVQWEAGFLNYEIKLWNDGHHPASSLEVEGHNHRGFQVSRMSIARLDPKSEATLTFREQRPTHQNGQDASFVHENRVRLTFMDGLGTCTGTLRFQMSGSGSLGPIHYQPDPPYAYCSVDATFLQPRANPSLRLLGDLGPEAVPPFASRPPS